MEYRNALSSALADEVREDYTFAREKLRKIIEEARTTTIRMQAIEMLMRLDAMYTGGYEPKGDIIESE